MAPRDFLGMLFSIGGIATALIAPWFDSMLWFGAFSSLTLGIALLIVGRDPREVWLRISKVSGEGGESGYRSGSSAADIDFSSSSDGGGSD